MTVTTKTSIKKYFKELMDSFLEKRFENIGYLPRWVIICIDVLILLLASFLTYFIVSNLTLKFHDTYSLTTRIVIKLLVNVFCFLIFKTYAGIIRYSTFIDALKLLLSTFSAYLILVSINYLHFFATGREIYLLPSLAIQFVISFMSLLMFRIAIKFLFENFLQIKLEKKLVKVLIYGVSSNSVALSNAINLEVPKRYKLVGFIDEKNSNLGKEVLGVPVINIKNKVSEILRKLEAEALIISNVTLPKDEKIKIIEDCLENNYKVLTVPSITDWNNNKEISKSIKTFEIQDLLYRDEIVLDNFEIFKKVSNKVILITGAAGSIGSEIVRQIIHYSPAKIILLDQAETPLHELTLELNLVNLEIIPVIIDVRNKEQLDTVFEQYKPDFVFHAAAYKHVPLMEKNPCQAIFTNVLGSKNLADLAVKYKVERFVLISTDKAVNPSNIMGGSKRIAEKYVQSLSIYLDQMGESSTKFITTRFGNVLGSNGSVVPLFMKQINAGGPITITHPDIIRYFMTIPEACQLVLEAGAMGKGSEIFIFDMGKPVRIIDLAYKMIKLAGFIPEEDIKIEVVGLRPGEKLFEELLTCVSKNLPTHHQKIMIANDCSENYISLNEDVLELIDLASENKSDALVIKMKQIVPEFISMNSKFEKFDN
jgi:FlaA1/EpsC-like NDP-sugar epimerase